MRGLLPRFCLLAALHVLSSVPSTAAERYDIVLRGGIVVDGTGAPSYKADVAVRGDQIVAIGRISGEAEVTLDIAGMMVTPGFIDMHNHSDATRLLDPHGPSYSLQGVTTEVWGEDLSMAPLGGKQDAYATWMPEGLHPTWKTFDEFLREVERKGSAANFCSFVGAGSVRAFVVGYANRAATRDELEAEIRLVRAAMLEGAMGLSSGLSYVPNIYMSTEELSALVTEAGRAGGIHATHARTINGQDPQAIHEVVSIAEKTGTPLHLFHLNSIASWSAPAFLPIIAAARERGVAVTADAYPYTWGITGLADYLPASAQEGGREAMLARLRDPQQRQRIARGFTTEPPFYATIGWQNVRLGVRDRRVNGRLVSEVAAERGVTAEDAYMDVVLEQRGQGLIIDLNNREDTLRMVMRQPYVAVGTDGNAVDLEADPPSVPLLHPRNIATFPRWLGHYVRAERLMSWEEAIRRMTSLPASILRLSRRGTLAVGHFADIVVFDPATIVDRATFADPDHYSQGIRHVLVNGQPVVKNGRPTQQLPGRALRGPGYRGEAAR